MKSSRLLISTRFFFLSFFFSNPLGLTPLSIHRLLLYRLLPRLVSHNTRRMHKVGRTITAVALLAVAAAAPVAVVGLIWICVPMDAALYKRCIEWIQCTVYKEKKEKKGVQKKSVEGIFIKRKKTEATKGVSRIRRRRRRRTRRWRISFWSIGRSSSSGNSSSSSTTTSIELRNATPYDGEMICIWNDVVGGGAA